MITTKDTQIQIRAKKETKSSTNQELINKLNWVLITVMALLIFCKYLFDPSMRIFDLFPFAFGLLVPSAIVFYLKRY